MNVYPYLRTDSSYKKEDRVSGVVYQISENFGAFVDIGIKQNGLIHVSNMGKKYVSNPNEVLKLHQHVKVSVIDVDLARGRIQLKLL